MSIIINKKYQIIVYLNLLLALVSSAFSPRITSIHNNTPSHRHQQEYHHDNHSTSIIKNHSQTQTSLFAQKNNKKRTATRNSIGNRTRSASGFGGAAIESCPCGSTLGYMKCCGKIHSNALDYANATPEQVVRARYSAYAKREIDFIIGSTHPLNKNFLTDIEHWRETIRTNCYDNFELKKCKIISEEYEGEGDKQIAKVKFIATMTQIDSREKTAFMEISTFERAGKHIRQGAWLYKSGDVVPVPVEDDESDDDDDDVKETSTS